MYQFASPLMQRMLPLFQRLANPRALQSPGMMSGVRTPDMLQDLEPPSALAPYSGAPQPAPRPTDYVNGVLRGTEGPPPAPMAPPAPSMEMAGPPPMPAPVPEQQTGSDSNPFPQPFGQPPQGLEMSGSRGQGNPFPTPMGSPAPAKPAAAPATTDTLDDANLMRGAMMNQFFKNSFPSFYNPNVGR